MAAVIGWDIGGAHVKAARAEDGRAVAALQLPCPLWRGLDLLPPVLAEAQARLGPADRHAVTMTGELADVFADRAEGVSHLARAIAAAVAPTPVAVWAGRGGFIAPGEAAGQAVEVASANWFATAAFVARAVGGGLLADMGSTTTDLVPFANGAPCPAGETDAARMACGELVYTGLVRSFVLALTERVPFAGTWTPLAGEYFATSADVHRLLGTLPEAADQMETADGRGKTAAESRGRLARMIGRDAAEATPQAWRDLAAFLAEAQLRRIEDAARLVLSRGTVPPDAPVIGAGCGQHVTRRLAERLGRPWHDFAALPALASLPPEIADQCAPAVAVALLG